MLFDKKALHACVTASGRRTGRTHSWGILERRVLTSRPENPNKCQGRPPQGLGAAARREKSHGDLPNFSVAQYRASIDGAIIGR